MELLRRFANKHRLNLYALLIIAFVVLVGNILYVSGYRDPNPMLQLSNLTTSSEPGALKGQDTIDPNNAFTSQALGGRAADAVTSGEMPYWNEYEGVGTPLLGEMQAAPLFPFTPLLKFDNGLLMSHMLLEIIAGFFTFLFLRRLGLGFAASIIGSVIFALNGVFAWLTNAVFNPIAFLPVLMYGIEVAVGRAKEGKKGGYAVMSVAVALSLYAGFPENAYINTIFATLWGLVRLFSLDTKAQKIQLFKKALAGYALGIALAAPALIAFFAYLLDAHIGGHDGAFAYAHLGWLSVPSHFLPYVYGSINAAAQYDVTGTLYAHWGSIGGYMTISTFVLAIVGLFSSIDRRLKILLIIWIVVCMMKTFGLEPGVFLWNLIPGIKSAAFYRYVIPTISFAMLILAAYGVHDLIKRGIKTRKLIIIAAICALSLLLFAVIAKNHTHFVATAPHFKVPMVGSFLWAGAITTILLIVSVIVRKKFLALAFVVIVSIDVLLMFTIPQLSTPVIKVDLAPVTYLQKNLGSDRFYTLGPISPNYGSYFGIASINNNDLPVPAKWSEYILEKLDSNTDPITFTGNMRKDPKGPTAFEEFKKNQDNYAYLGVKYLVTFHGQLTNDDIAQTGLKLTFSTNTVDIYELSRHDSYFAASDNCKVDKMVSKREVTVHCDKNGSIVRKELWMDGWSASVNGKSIEVKPEKDLFQKVELPAGDSRVRFDFAPPFIQYGWVLFFIGFVGVVIDNNWTRRNIELVQNVITKKAQPKATHRKRK